MATAAAAVILSAQQDVYGHFLSRNAVTPENAVSYEPRRSFERREFERATGRGVIVESEPGRWYLDPARYDEKRRSDRRSVGLVVAGVAAALAVVLTFA